MEVLKTEQLPDGSKKYYFVDGTSTILSKEFLARCEKISRKNPSVGRKNANCPRMKAIVVDKK